MSNFKFTIGRRVGLGFGILILFIIVIFTLTFIRVNEGNRAFEESTKLSKTLSDIYNPSNAVVTALNKDIASSRNLIEVWVSRGVRRDEKNKRTLLLLMNEKIPNNVNTMIELQKNWPKEREKELAIEVQKQAARLISQYRVVTDTFLREASDYLDSSGNNSINLLFADNVISPGGEMDKIGKQVLNNLHELELRIKKHVASVTKSKDQKLKSTTDAFNNMIRFIAFLGGLLILGAIVVATFTTRSIVRPINQLNVMLSKMGRGVIPNEKMKVSNDEIGEMAIALNNMVEGFRRTTEFSRQVGSGNFDYHYQPLSSEDTLGHALLKMRDDLAENERILEQKVVERTEEVVRQRDEIERQRHKLEELYKDVTDSIRYAKRLQDSILPPEKYIGELLPDSFVLFKPKDIVSGDFYWFERTNNKVLFAAVDCTGHGVPGAFMSLVGANALNQAVREHNLQEPANILDDLNKLSSEFLNKQNEDSDVRDGMDLALCAIDIEKKVLEYAGANNPLYIIRNDEIMVTKADKFAIGSMTEEKYTNHKIQLEPGDSIYVFSDGYADQFGGPKGKKFMYKQFRETLKSLKGKPMQDQKRVLDEKIESWKGKFEQIDDILVIGVKI